MKNRSRLLIAAIFVSSLLFPGISEAARPVVKPAPGRSAAQPVSKGESAAAIQGVSETARIDSARRKVEVQNAGQASWSPAKQNQALKTSDKLRTGDRSVVRLKLKDGSKVLLLQNSEAELEGLTSVQKTVRLLRGRVRAIVSRLRDGNQFKIKTPVGVASVRGTDFEVEFSEEGGEMQVDVRNGQVGVSKLGDLSDEVILNPGESLRFGADRELGDPVRTGSLPLNRQDVRSEVQIASARDAVVSMAAAEARNAEIQLGKSLIDMHGERVRVESYITRPETNQYKMVALNSRANRFDYFTYTGTFNRDLPEDISEALRDANGKLGASAPDYYLTQYETTMSNTVDTVRDVAQDGHLVKVEFDGTNYTLTDNADPTKTRTIAAAELQIDGTYRIYNPIKDSFQVVTAADRDEAVKVSMRNSETGNYQDLAGGDTAWKTRFNSYDSFINSTTKASYDKKASVTNTLAVDLDATWSHAPVATVIDFPSGENNLHNRLNLYYSDGSRTTIDTAIIDDDGEILPRAGFAGITSGADYRNLLDANNYEQDITSTEMSGRNIRLVIDPRIVTRAGLD